MVLFVLRNKRERDIYSKAIERKVGGFFLWIADGGLTSGIDVCM